MNKYQEALLKIYLKEKQKKEFLDNIYIMYPFREATLEDLATDRKSVV